MRSLALRSFLAVLTAALTLCAVALAVATTSSDETSPPAVASVNPSPAPTSGSRATDVPENDETGAAASEPVEGEPTEDPTEDADTGESPQERTTAVNPAGHCVDLPSSSNVIKDPDKHPNWTIQPCEPNGDVTSPDADNPEGDSGSPDIDDPNDAGDTAPEGRTPALNPDGLCIEMPNNSDIIRHREKHPKWTVAACSTSGDGP